MAIKKPIPITFNLDSHQSVQSVCAVIHIDDKNTETLDLSLMQGGEHVETPSNSTVTARFVRVKDKKLISDNVACAVQENGNILIPIDNAAAKMLTGEIKIEVNIVDENDVLTMQFPLVIRVNNTILADAEISPESEGTIPELLEEAREAAESATQAAKAATEAISTKQDKLTAGDNITIEDNVISATGGGVTDYNELDNLPEIISANSSTGWGVKFPLKDTLNVRSFLYRTINPETNETKLNIKNNAITYEMLESAFQNELFKDYGVLTNPPSDFYTNESSAPVRNGIWKIIPSSPLDGAPTTKPHRLINYYNESERIQLVITNPQEDSFGKEQLFMRVQCMGNLGVWQELTGGGSQIVSGVVNANGTITFTDSEGNSFTTSGESVIGAEGFSPSATVQQTASGATITVTDKNGTTTANISNGQDGNDYVLTAQDKDDIADIVLTEFTGSIVNGELNTR